MFCSILECYHYTFLNESSRANSFYNISIDFLCDDDLNGWYRFGGDAGKQMADSCVPEFRCGAELTGWLNGSHPEIAEVLSDAKFVSVTKTIVVNTQQASQSVTVEDSTSTTLGSPQFVTFVTAATEHTNQVRI